MLPYVSETLSQSSHLLLFSLLDLAQRLEKQLSIDGLGNISLVCD